MITSGESCKVCGSLISENNTTGIGFGCMNNIVIPAKKDCFKEFKGLDLWIAKVKLVKEVFLQQYKETKFRSDFKKSFFESMKTTERVSKKQLDIMIDWLAYDRISFDFYNDCYLPLFNSFDPSFECEELYKERLEMHKKLYLSGKKNRTELV